jgi:hypothetical protein
MEFDKGEWFQGQPFNVVAQLAFERNINLGLIFAEDRESNTLYVVCSAPLLKR